MPLPPIKKHKNSACLFEVNGRKRKQAIVGQLSRRRCFRGLRDTDLVCWTSREKLAPMAGRRPWDSSFAGSSFNVKLRPLKNAALHQTPSLRLKPLAPASFTPK